MYAKIEPVAVYPDQATILSINNVNVTPGRRAVYQWWLQNEARENLTTDTIELLGPDYDAWGDNDEYLYTFAATKLALTINEFVYPVEPTVVAPEPVVVPDAVFVSPPVEPAVVAPEPVVVPDPVFVPPTVDPLLADLSAVSV